MKTFSILIRLIPILLFTHNIYGQDENRFPIYCNYTYSDNISEMDSTLLVSLVERKLRTLGDTQLVSRDEYEKTFGAFSLDLHLLKINDANGRLLGYVIFTIYLQQYLYESGLSTFIGKYWGATVDIEENVTSMVAYFDQRILKFSR